MKNVGMVARHAGWIALCVASLACASPPTPKAANKPAPPPVAAPDAPPGTISRAELELVLRHGPPWVLQRVPIEEVLEKGKFVGWRVQDVPPGWDADLVAGDVVTSINALPLETPKDFWAAWTTLSVASELKVAYMRDGEKREIAIPIHGSPNPAVAAELARDPTPRRELPTEASESPLPANQKYNKPKQYDTIVISPPARYESDTNVDWSD
jgi:hypothetical protein